jgi:hypothetical protein
MDHELTTGANTPLALEINAIRPMVLAEPIRLQEKIDVHKTIVTMDSTPGVNTTIAATDSLKPRLPDGERLSK